MGRFWGGFLIFALAGAAVIHNVNASCAREGWMPANHNCKEVYVGSGLCGYECPNKAGEGGHWQLKYNAYEQQPETLTVECPVEFSCIDLDLGNVGPILSQSKKVVWKNCPIPGKHSLGSIFQQWGLANVNTLTIDSNHEMNPHVRQFDGLNNLKALNWFSTQFLETEAKIATALGGLETLVIKADHVQTTNEFLAHFQKLSKFEIEYSNTLYIESGAIGQIKGLGDVSISFSGPIRVVHQAPGIGSFSPAITIDGGVFQQNPQLTAIRIVNFYDFAVLPHNLIHNHWSLQNFTFTGTSVVSIPTNFFQKSPQIIYINMGGNKIERIEHNTFTGLNNLRWLIMNYNGLKTIDSNAFQSVPSIRFIDFSWNDLTFNNFAGNSPFDGLTNIEKIDLSHNQFTKIFPDWTRTSSINSIDLSYNSLTSIKTLDVNFSQPNIVVNIEHNQISSFDFDYVNEKPTYKQSNDSSKVIIQVGENPIKCFKNSQPARDFVMTLRGQRYIRNTNNYVYFEPQGVTCQNEDGKILPIDQVYTCPNLCDCQQDHTQLIYTINCNSRGLTVVPPELPYVPDYSIILDLSNNSLTQLPNANQPGYKHVTECIASNNQFESITSDNVWINLKVLDVQGNSGVFTVDPIVVSGLNTFLWDKEIATTVDFNFGVNNQSSPVPGGQDCSKKIETYLQGAINVNSVTINFNDGSTCSQGTLKFPPNVKSGTAVGVNPGSITHETFENNKPFRKCVIVCKKPMPVRPESPPTSTVNPFNENTFIFNSNMTLLNMSNMTEIFIIPGKLFYPLVNLEKLIFANNDLRVLPDTVFDKNRELIHVDLSFNQLKSFSNIVFSGLTKLETLKLNDNQFFNINSQCFFSLTNLKVVNFANNQLSFDGFNQSPFFNNHRITKLLLANNKVKKILPDWRVQLPDLQILDLEFNLLPEISFENLQFKQKHDVHVNLGSNEIYHIRLPYTMEQPQVQGRHTVFVNIQKNPLNCDCSSVNFAKYLRGEWYVNYGPITCNQIQFEDNQNLVCGGSGSQKVSQITNSNLQCPDLSKHIPKSCAGYLDRAKHQLVIDCSHLKLTQAPTEIVPYPNYGTRLILTDNHLTVLPSKKQPGYSSVVELDVTSNQITEVTADNCWSGFKVFHINNNPITSFSDEFIRVWTQNPELKVEYDSSKINKFNLDFCQNSGVSSSMRFPFMQQPSYGIEGLHLTCSKVQIGPELFANVPNLKSFTSYNNHEVVITSNAFKGLFNLEHLELSFPYVSTSNDYPIITLTNGIFSDNSRLVHISITNITKCGGIEPEVFKGLNKLDNLTFSWNNLGSLPDRIFKDCSSLTVLDLSHNKLNFISQDTFIDLTHLKVVDLSHNHLNLLDVAGQSVNIFASNNGIHEIHLQHNKITRMFPEWTQLPHIKIIDLSNNQITEIQNKDVHFQNGNVDLNLNNNFITLLGFNYIDGRGRAKRHTAKIHLLGNPLTCDCSLNDFNKLPSGDMSILVSNNLDFVGYYDLMCKIPDNEQTVPIFQFEADCDLWEPWMQDCPRTCKCAKNELKKSYDVDCYGKGLVTAPAKIVPPEADYKTYLNMSRNALTELPSKTQPGYNTVIQIFAHENQISQIRLDNLPPNLQLIDVTKNPVGNWINEVVEVLQSIRYFGPALPKLPPNNHQIVVFHPDAPAEEQYEILVNLLKNKSGTNNLQLEVVCVNIDAKLTKIVKDLEILNVTDNVVPKIDKEALAELPKLKFMKMTFIVKNKQRPSNEVTGVLKSGTFANKVNLEVIVIAADGDSSFLYEIEKDAFVNLNSLRELNISHTGLRILPERLFTTPCKTLTSVDFSYNQLQSISDKLFAGLESLKELYINNNNLDFISFGAFKDFTHLQIVDLSHNQLNLLDAAGQSINIFASNNEIHKLYLQHNKITRMFSEWTKLPNIEIIDLSYNQLTEIHNEDVHFPNGDVKLYLNNNKITLLGFKYIDGKGGAKTHTTSVTLLGNPLKYDCSLNDYNKLPSGDKSIPVSNNVNFVDYDDLICIRPDNEQTLKVKAFDGHCGKKWVLWNQDCPSTCKCSKNELEKFYDVNCNGKGLVSAPAKIVLPGANYVTFLRLEKNQLTNLPSITQPGYDKVIQIFAAENQISQIHSYNLPPNIQLLDVRNSPVENWTYDVVQVLKKILYYGPTLPELPPTVSPPKEKDSAVVYRPNEESPEEQYEILINLLKRNLGAKELDVTRVGYNIDSKLMENAKDLEILKATDNIIPKIDKEALANLPNLKFMKMTFIVKNNKRPKEVTRVLESHTFAHNEKLEEIFISADGDFSFLYKIEKDAFANLKSLKKLTITHTSLRTLPEHLFTSSCDALYYVDLSYNKLESIPKYFFAELINIKELYLNNNVLSKVPSSAFSDLSNLLTLQLSYNNLRSELFMQGHFAACRRLQKVYLDHNHISIYSHDWFAEQVKLELLSMTFNDFESLNDLFFKLVQRHKSVLLDSNKISSINVKTVAQGSNNVRVQVNENPIDCSCAASQDLVEYIQNNKANSLLDVERATCHNNGALLKDMTREKMGCPSFKNYKCPKDCQCTEYAAKKIVNINCSFLNLRSCPKELDTFSDYDTYLNVEQNKITTLPYTNARGYDRVVVLRADQNHISSIKENNLLPKLKHLDLNHNKFNGDLSRRVNNKIEDMKITVYHSTPLPDEYKLK